MSDPFLGQITTVAFDWPPVNYAKCDGQTIAITQNQALYALLGTNFGGNGVTNFDLPDLRGRTPIHPYAATGSNVGSKSGLETVSLSLGEIPRHSHLMKATTQTNGGTPIPDNTQMLGPTEVADPMYTNATNLTALAPDSISAVGGGQPHNNMQPYLVINFCIALTGTFPSRN